MSVATQTGNDTLARLLRKVAVAKGEANIPPTQHATGKADDGTQAPTHGVTATEQKPKVQASVQGSAFDGSKMPEGDGDKEHGIARMESGEKSSITPKPADDNPKKLASLSNQELLKQYEAFATPIAAQLLVDAAKTTSETPKQAAAATTPATTPAAPAPAATTPDVQKAAQAGAQDAEMLVNHFIAMTVKEASEAADLLADLTKLSLQKQAQLVKEAKEREAAKQAAEAPVMPPEAAAAPAAMPAPAGPSGPAGPAPMGDGDADDVGMPQDGKMDDKQLEQLLMALLEQEGHADPKVLEESADPVAKEVGKQARAFMKSGKFQVRPVKDAKDRAAINHMKQFIRETAR